MGQQQLLLIVLGVIIVGIAIVVGINLFTTSSQSSSRDILTSQLVNLGAQAQQFYRKPTSMGGGGNDFGGFALTTAQSSNDAGTFAVTTTKPAAVGDVAASTVAAGAGQIIYIVGSGKDLGTDNATKVKSYVTVSATGVVLAPSTDAAFN